MYFNQWINMNLYKIILIILIFISFIIILLFNNLTSFLFITLIGICFCIAWSLKYKKVDNIEFNYCLKNEHSIIRFIDIVYFIIIIFIIILIYNRPLEYNRPLLFFILICFMSSLIGFKIMINGNKLMMLFQIIILSLCILFSQQILFPGLLGIDPYYHRNLVLQIIKTQYIPNTGSYADLPVFHLAIITIMDITGYQYKAASELLVCSSQIICLTLLIFLIGYKFIGSYKAGLLGALFINIADSSILMAYWPIPNSLAIIFIILILYLVLDYIIKKRLISVFLIIFLCLLTALIHPIGSIAIILIFIIIYISLYKNIDNHFSINILILSIVIPFAYWTFVTGHIAFIGNELKSIINIDVTLGFRTITSDLFKVPLTEQIINLSGMGLFIAGSLIGIFYLSSSNKISKLISSISIGFIIISIVALISPLIPLEHRWFFICEILLAIPLAVTLLLIKSIKFSILFIFLITFLMIINPLGSMDNTFYSPNTKVTSSLEYTELTSISYTDYHKMINCSSDDYYSYVALYGQNITILSGNNYIINNNNSNMTYFILRETIITSPFRYDSGIMKLNNDTILKDLYNNSKIYDNKVEIYIF
jgi:hypothetical protein